MAITLTDRPDVQRMEEAIRTIPRPEGVGPARLVFDADHSGDASAYVLFRIARRTPISAAKAKVLANFADAVAAALYQLGTGLLYYVQFEEGR